MIYKNPFEHTLTLDKGTIRKPLDDGCPWIEAEACLATKPNVAMWRCPCSTAS